MDPASLLHSAFRLLFAIPGHKFVTQGTVKPKKPLGNAASGEWPRLLRHGSIGPPVQHRVARKVSNGRSVPTISCHSEGYLQVLRSPCVKKASVLGKAKCKICCERPGGKLLRSRHGQPRLQEEVWPMKGHIVQRGGLSFAGPLPRYLAHKLIWFSKCRVVASCTVELPDVLGLLG